jgi:poly-gamma-glutamate capsule biosynthesis protein CapA/YwtB (metallophosphatase superfamily)
MNRIRYNSKLNILLLLFISGCQFLSGQQRNPSENKISLIFIGDIMGHDEQIWSAENRETHEYNYDEVFKYIKPVISDADITIANFEVTLAGPPYKGYPQFSSPAELAVACSNAGIDYFATANNHSADRGKNGIVSTIHKLDSMGFLHTGTFLSSAHHDTLSPLMISRNGFSIALLNYTYGTNGIKVPEPVIVNMLDKELITRDIKKAESKNADIIVLFLHWGTEYDTIPSGAQTDLAAYFLSSGADLVIGSHPHVLQKMVWSKNQESGKEGIVVYSLGNFISNQRKPKTDGGSIAKIELTKTGDRIKVSEAGFFLTWVYTPIEKYRKKFFILPCSQFENNSAFFAAPADFDQMTRFIRDSRALLYKQNIGIGEYIYNGKTWLLNN